MKDLKVKTPTCIEETIYQVIETIPISVDNDDNGDNVIDLITQSKAKKVNFKWTSAEYENKSLRDGSLYDNDANYIKKNDTFLTHLIRMKEGVSSENAEKLIQIFSKKNVDVNHVCGDGNNALSLAVIAMERSPHIYKILMDKFKDTLKLDSACFQTTMKALIGKVNEDTLCLFFNDYISSTRCHDLDIFAKDTDGHSALDYAARYKYEKLFVEILRHVIENEKKITNESDFKISIEDICLPAPYLKNIYYYYRIRDINEHKRIKENLVKNLISIIHNTEIDQDNIDIVLKILNMKFSHFKLSKEYPDGTETIHETSVRKVSRSLLTSFIQESSVEQLQKLISIIIKNFDKINDETISETFLLFRYNLDCNFLKTSNHDLENKDDELVLNFNLTDVNKNTITDDNNTKLYSIYECMLALYMSNRFVNFQSDFSKCQLKTFLYNSSDKYYEMFFNKYSNFELPDWFNHNLDPQDSIHHILKMYSKVIEYCKFINSSNDIDGKKENSVLSKYFKDDEFTSLFSDYIVLGKIVFHLISTSNDFFINEAFDIIRIALQQSTFIKFNNQSNINAYILKEILYPNVDKNVIKAATNAPKVLTTILTEIAKNIKSKEQIECLQTALYEAANFSVKINQKESLKLLLDFMPDLLFISKINAINNTTSVNIITSSYLYNNSEILEFLLDRGLANKKLHSCLGIDNILIQSIKDKRHDVTQMIVYKCFDANVNYDYRNLKFFKSFNAAVYYGAQEIVELFLEKIPREYLLSKSATPLNKQLANNIEILLYTAIKTNYNENVQRVIETLLFEYNKLMGHSVPAQLMDEYLSCAIKNSNIKFITFALINYQDLLVNIDKFSLLKNAALANLVGVVKLIHSKLFMNNDLSDEQIIDLISSSVTCGNIELTKFFVKIDPRFETLEAKYINFIRCAIENQIDIGFLQVMFAKYCQDIILPTGVCDISNPVYENFIKSLLFFSIISKNKTAFSFLIEDKSELLKLMDENGKTVFNATQESNDVDIRNIAIKIRGYLSDQLCLSIDNNLVNKVNNVLSKNIDLSISNTKNAMLPICVAIASKKVKIIKTIFEECIKQNIFQNPTICEKTIKCAIENKNSEILGALINKYKVIREALYYAFKCGDVDIVKFILTKFVQTDSNFDDVTPIFYRDQTITVFHFKKCNITSSNHTNDLSFNESINNKKNYNNTNCTSNNNNITNSNNVSSDISRDINSRPSSYYNNIINNDINAIINLCKKNDNCDNSDDDSDDDDDDDNDSTLSIMYEVSSIARYIKNLILEVKGLKNLSKILDIQVNKNQSLMKLIIENCDSDVIKNFAESDDEDMLCEILISLTKNSYFKLAQDFIMRAKNLPLLQAKKYIDNIKIIEIQHYEDIQSLKTLCKNLDNLQCKEKLDTSCETIPCDKVMNQAGNIHTPKVMDIDHNTLRNEVARDIVLTINNEFGHAIHHNEPQIPGDLPGDIDDSVDLRYLGALDDF